jgi:hypothetical protein
MEDLAAMVEYYSGYEKKRDKTVKFFPAFAEI